MPRLSLVAVAVLVAACTSRVGTESPSADGELAGGSLPTSNSNAPPAAPTSSPTPPPSSTSTPTPPPSSGNPGADAGTGWGDAGGWEVDTGVVPTPEASVPPTQPTGALGSCTNPACATDGTECGCTATGLNGDTFQIGCQAGGQCVCVEDGNVVGQPFDENGACGTSQLTSQQFLAYCTCQ